MPKNKEMPPTLRCDGRVRRLMRRVRGVRLIAIDRRARHFSWTTYVVMVWRDGRWSTSVTTGEFKWALQCYRQSARERHPNIAGQRRRAALKLRAVNCKKQKITE